MFLNFTFLHKYLKMKKVYVLMLTLPLFFMGCERKRVDDPTTAAYWLGKWNFEEVYEIDGDERQTYIVSGTVKFKKMLKADMYGSGEFEIEIAAPNAMYLPETLTTYKAEFTWRIKTMGITVMIDGDDDITPVLGVGRTGIADFNFSWDFFKEDFIEIMTNPLPPGISGSVRHSILLTR